MKLLILCIFGEKFFRIFFKFFNLRFKVSKKLSKIFELSKKISKSLNFLIFITNLPVFCLTKAVSVGFLTYHLTCPRGYILSTATNGCVCAIPPKSSDNDCPRPTTYDRYTRCCLCPLSLCMLGYNYDPGTCRCIIRSGRRWCKKIFVGRWSGWRRGIGGFLKESWGFSLIKEPKIYILISKTSNLENLAKICC